MTQNLKAIVEDIVRHEFLEVEILDYGFAFKTQTLTRVLIDTLERKTNHVFASITYERDGMRVLFGKRGLNR